MEEKLPEQIMDNVLLEGVNSQELLQNTDIVNFSNILANLRYDLSAIMNEDIDEFTFQLIKIHITILQPFKIISAFI